MAKKAPAHTVLQYAVTNGTSYIDLAEDLSKINRRLYRQGMQYAVSKIDFHFNDNPVEISAIQLGAHVAGDTWVVHNAWKKAQAHWLAQQRQARRLIGQSAKPTWEDFKVYLDDAHRAGSQLDVVAGDGAVVGSGEWDYSRLVWEEDDASTDSPYLHLIGGNVSTTDWGLILGYQESRATVQPEDPDLPAEYSTSMYARLAQDENAVADVVANAMEETNDEPPYDQDDYPGSDTNSDAPWAVQTARAAPALKGQLGPFVAQCGLIAFQLGAVNPVGGTTAASTTYAYVHLAPGGYQGVAAIPMGQ